MIRPLRPASAFPHLTPMFRIAILWLMAGALLLASMPAVAGTYLQCVPFARELSGVQIYGNANTWWGQASGRYERGTRPKLGAVMTFKPTGEMPLGHVAVVTRIKGKRELLISHANWSPINGRRGQIERNVLAVDVSDANDWSMVRIWYAPMQGLGARTNPLHGFIYPKAVSPALAEVAKGAPTKGAKQDEKSRKDAKDAKKALKQQQKADKAAQRAAERAARKDAARAKKARKNDERGSSATDRAVPTGRAPGTRVPAAGRPDVRDPWRESELTRAPAQTKAVVRPAVPSAKPPAKPAARTVAQPAPKPASRPAAQPTPKPTAVPAAGKKTPKLDAIVARLGRDTR